MKKMKKLFALLMTLAMVMGLGITGFAAVTPVTDIVSDITVTGLSAGVETNITGYKFATLQYNDATNEYSWDIATWAQEYVTLNAAGTAFQIADEDLDSDDISDLKEAAMASGNSDTNVTAENISATSHIFQDVPIGGYILIPSDSNADYSPLFAVNTYKRDGSPVDGKPVAQDITVAAKSGTHTIVKEDGDDFAQIGQKVDYTIRATFPALTSNEDNLESFVITDTSTGLDINDDIVVTLGEDTLTKGTQYTVGEDTQNGKTIVTITFDSSLFQENNVGKDVVITYSAIVTDVEYNNTASATSSTTDYTSDETSGDNGSIEITKVDAENENLVLKGVEFEVYDLGDKLSFTEQNPGNPMRLVYDADLKAYRPEIGEEGNAVTKITTKETSSEDDGKLTIVGLDEGYYYFKETKAPSGYAINENGLTVQIIKDENEELTVKFLNTKMAALPSTGGMGTTLFTIAGCVIMISAAGLFFATRKKAN